MIEFSLFFVVASFIAGVLTFFAPCTMPLVPAFLSVIAGVGQNELQNAEASNRIKRKIFINAIFYVLGFSVIFVLLGAVFSFAGTIVSIKEWIQRVSGLLIIIFGLFVLGIIKIQWLNAEKRLHSSKLFEKASHANSFLIGSLFALGWSPCVGPILGGILFLASTRGSVLQGTILLIAFTIGLAIPFLLTALFFGYAVKAFAKWANALKIVNIIAGIFLIILGVLIFFDQAVIFFSWIQRHFANIDFFEKLLIRYDGNLK